MEKWIHIFFFFSLYTPVVIIPTRLVCQMQANSSGAEFLSTKSNCKFMMTVNFVIACLRPSQNVKLGIFTGRTVVQLTAKKCTKKRDARAKLLFSLVKLLLIWLSRHRRILNFLLCPIIYDTLWSVKNRIFRPNAIAPADTIPNVFSTHR